MPELPTGTVTFFFSDVEGSTAHLQRLGSEEYGRLLGEHHRRMREVFVRRNGKEISTEGDSFFVLFSSAAGAVGAAADAQDALAGLGLQVRIGVHTGEAVVRDGVYVGLDVHRAARVAAAANGGQALLSGATRALVPDAVVRDLGEHRLKDLERVVRLYQLGLGDFPPVRSLRAVRMPVPSTPLLGRHRELADVAALLDRGELRLVTLAGPGGSGKTRLAIEAASRAGAAFTDGARWVGLAPLADVGEVWGALAQSLETRQDPLEYLADRELLLLLDNAEHLAGIDERVSQILAAASAVRVLVTSREPLRLVGEWVYQVDPLESDDAVELFAARAAAAGRGVDADETVRALCARLDDLPLAVELAAARTPVLSPAKILERLEQRLPALASAGKDAPGRQRTLEATIDWSYDLCSGEERALFARLGVFVDGCTLEAAEEVCGADLDVLASLVAKQLVRLRGDRYWMLETIHEFAQDRLSELPDAADLERRHQEWYAAASDAAYDEMTESWMPDHLIRQLAADQRNFEVAIDRAIRRGDIDCALRIATTFQGVYESRGLMGAWRAMLEQIFDSTPADAIAPILTTRRNTLECLSMLISLQAAQGDLDGAQARGQRYLDVARTQQNPELEAWVLCSLAELAIDDLQSARAMFLRAGQLAAETDDPRTILQAWIGAGLAAVELDRGDFTSARRIAEELAAADDKFTRMNALCYLASATFALDDEPAARAALAGYLDGQGTAAIGPDACWILAALSISTDPELAALFIGAADRIESDWGGGGVDARRRFEETLRIDTAETTRENLGKDTYDRLRQEGRDTPLHLLLDRAHMPSQSAATGSTAPV